MSWEIEDRNYNIFARHILRRKPPQATLEKLSHTGEVRHEGDDCQVVLLYSDDNSPDNHEDRIEYFKRLSILMEMDARCEPEDNIGSHTPRITVNRDGSNRDGSQTDDE